MTESYISRDRWTFYGVVSDHSVAAFWGGAGVCCQGIDGSELNADMMIQTRLQEMAAWNHKQIYLSTCTFVCGGN